MLRTWLGEANDKGLLREGLDHKEIANFIVISLNGAVALFEATKDIQILKQTVTQLQDYVNQLKK